MREYPGAHYLWSQQGIYQAMKKAKSEKRLATLRKLIRNFESLIANDGARILSMSLSDAKVLWVMTFQAEAIADQVLSDPKANQQEMAQAIILKMRLSMTRFYLAWRDDYEDITKAHHKGKFDLEKTIPPIIERHLEDKVLFEDDLADGLR